MHPRDKPLTYLALKINRLCVHKTQRPVIDWNKVFKGLMQGLTHPRVCTEAVIWKVPRLYGKEINFLILKGPTGILSRNGEWLAKASDLKKKKILTFFPSSTAIFSLQMTGPSFTLSLCHAPASHYLPKGFSFLHSTAGALGFASGDLAFAVAI